MVNFSLFLFLKFGYYLDTPLQIKIRKGRVAVIAVPISDIPTNPDQNFPDSFLLLFHLFFSFVCFVVKNPIKIILI